MANTEITRLVKQKTNFHSSRRFAHLETLSNPWVPPRPYNHKTLDTFACFSFIEFWVLQTPVLTVFRPMTSGFTAGSPLTHVNEYDRDIDCMVDPVQYKESWQANWPKLDVCVRAPSINFGWNTWFKQSQGLADSQPYAWGGWFTAMTVYCCMGQVAECRVTSVPRLSLPSSLPPERKMT